MELEHVARPRPRRKVGDAVETEAAEEHEAVVAGAAGEEVVAIAAEEAIVAGRRRDRVVAGLAVERVVAAVADHVVAEDVAGAVDVAGTGEDQAFDVRPKRVARRACHDVVRSGGCAGGFDDDVEGAVDDVGVVAVAADERVVAELAVEIVVADAACDRIRFRRRPSARRRRARHR